MSLKPDNRIWVNVPSTGYVGVGPEDEVEHYVKVKWLETTDLNEAVKEKGFFGDQNTVARPKSEMRSHTIERLQKRFRVTY